MDEKPSDMKKQEIAVRTENKPIDSATASTRTKHDAGQDLAGATIAKSEESKNFRGKKEFHVWLQRQVHEHASDWVNVILAAAIVYFTWSSGQQSDRIMKAAEDNAKAAGGFSQSAANISKDINVAKENFRRIADSSKKSIEATQDALRLDQRAWITLKGIGGKPELDQPWEIHPSFVNTGRTPAMNVRFSCNFETAKSEKALVYKEAPFGARSILAPNDQTYHCILNPMAIPKVTQPMLDELKSKRITLFVFGTLIYDDVFGKQHWLVFCRFMHPDGNTWGGCERPERNAMGDGKNPK